MAFLPPNNAGMPNQEMPLGADPCALAETVCFGECGAWCYMRKQMKVVRAAWYAIRPRDVVERVAMIATCLDHAFCVVIRYCTV